MTQRAGWLTRSNNFDAVRIIAALFVVFGHSFALTGRPENGPRLFGAPIESLGLYIFFVVSGFLIAEAWLRQPRFGLYVRNRSLRIFPGLIVVTALTFAVLGPVVSTLSVGQYFASPDSWRYLLNAILRPVFALPGVFGDVPYKNSVNGSLWSLPIEFFCYLLIPVLLSVPKRFRVLTVTVFGVGSAAFYLFAEQQVVVYGTSINRAAQLWAFFAAGTLIALLSRYMKPRLDVAIAVIVVHCIVVAAIPSIALSLLWLTLPYPLIVFCVHATGYIKRAARYGDFSYGLYIYAFPIQQIVVSYLGVLPIAVNFVIVVGLTSIAAALSWWLVERPALSLKSKPWRGSRNEASHRAEPEIPWLSPAEN